MEWVMGFFSKVRLESLDPREAKGFFTPKNSEELADFKQQQGLDKETLIQWLIVLLLGVRRTRNEALCRTIIYW